MLQGKKKLIEIKERKKEENKERGKSNMLAILVWSFQNLIY
jgi:hypothetical protein